MNVNLYGKAEDAANRILEAFKNGNVAEALAPIFLKRDENVPCRKWSWNNQFLTAIMGHSDARGFQQWLKVGRAVRKGEKSFCILAPCTRLIDDTENPGKKRVIVTGFRGQPVFGLVQTDIINPELWAKHNVNNDESDRFIDALPLKNVAEEWGLTVTAFSGKDQGAKGWYAKGHGIALGVENLATWAHEFIHAADDRAGNLTERGQHWRSEVVAELGGSILLCCIGLERDADTGGAWEYIQHYAKESGQEAVDACLKVLKRTCEAVKLVLNTAFPHEQSTAEVSTADETEDAEELVTA